MEATKPGTGPSPMEGTQDTLNSPSSELCHLPGEPITDSVPRVFTEGCSRWLPLPGTYQTSRLPTGKLMASINHAVCTNNPGAVSTPLSVRERGRALPKSSQPLASLANRLLQEGSLGFAMLTRYHTGRTYSHPSRFLGSSSPPSKEHGLCPVPLCHPGP